MNIKETFILDPTVLETPTYVLAIVLLVFLVLSLALDHGIHGIKHWLVSSGRAGLAEAVDKAVLELTILGFVSIILLLFRGYAEAICIPYSQTQVSWTILNDLQNCPCCMSETKGITTCAQMYHRCAFNSTSGETFCGCEAGESGGESSYTSISPPSDNATALIAGGAAAAAEAAAGGTCVAYVDTERDFIFYQFADKIKDTATKLGANSTRICDRILNSTTNTSPLAAPPTMAIAPFPGVQLRRHLQQETSLQTTAAPYITDEESYIAENETRHVIPDIQTFRCEGPFPAGDCPAGQIPAIGTSALDQIHLLVFLISCIHVAASILVIVLATLRMKQWRWWQNQYLKELHANKEENVVEEEGKREQGVENTTASNGATAGVVENSQQQDPEKGIEERRSETLNTSVSLPPQASTTLSTPSHTAPLPAWRRRLSNVAFIIGRSFIPVPVSKRSFLTMRSHYLNSLGLPLDFDFVNECAIHLDYDLSRIIGASVQMWVILLFVWVVVGVALWIISLVLLLSLLITLAINILMVAAIKSSAEGKDGENPAVRAATHWYNDYRTLAIPLGGIIFYCSKMFTVALFLFWQFGAGCCFLSNDSNLNSVLTNGMPYWSLILVAGIVLLWLASVTVPMWALVVHMRPHHSWVEEAAAGGGGADSGGTEDESPSPRGRIISPRGTSMKWESQAEILAEINRLQEKLMDMQ